MGQKESPAQSGMEEAQKLRSVYLHAARLGNELATRWARRLGFPEQNPPVPAARQLRNAASELNASPNEENS